MKTSVAKRGYLTAAILLVGAATVSAAVAQLKRNSTFCSGDSGPWAVGSTDTWHDVCVGDARVITGGKGQTYAGLSLQLLTAPTGCQEYCCLYTDPVTGQGTHRCNSACSDGPRYARAIGVDANGNTIGPVLEDMFADGSSVSASSGYQNAVTWKANVHYWNIDACGNSSGTGGFP